MLRSTTVLTAIMILVTTAGAAFGAPDGAHEPLWGNLALRVFNFALFIGVITFFFGKKIVAFFKGRTKGISDEIASLEQRKTEAALHLEEIGARIARLEKERQAILDDYTAQGEALKAAIVAQAEKSATRIMEQAQSTARNEIQQAMDDMRKQMAEEITAATERMLSEKLDAAEHAKLIDKYLTKVVLN